MPEGLLTPKQRGYEHAPHAGTQNSCQSLSKNSLLLNFHGNREEAVLGFFCGIYESSHLQGCLINKAPEASSPVPWSPQLSTWEAHQGIKEGKTNGACKGIISFWGAKAKALEGPYEALSSSSFVCLCNSLVPAGRSSAAQL